MLERYSGILEYMNTKIILVAAMLLVATIVAGYYVSGLYVSDFITSKAPEVSEPSVEISDENEYLWQETTFADGSVVTPIQTDVFTLIFEEDRMLLGTDCNSGSANFVAGDAPVSTFTVGAIASTKMYCEGSQETEYFSMIASIVQSDVSESGRLIFTLDDGSVMTYFAQESQ